MPTALRDGRRIRHAHLSIVVEIGGVPAFERLRDEEGIEEEVAEYLAALMARPDNWDSHYNLGNYYLGQNRPKEALAEYDQALKMEPQATLALVNAAMAHGRLGEPAKAEEKLVQALKIRSAHGVPFMGFGP